MSFLKVCVLFYCFWFLYLCVCNFIIMYVDIVPCLGIIALFNLKFGIYHLFWKFFNHYYIENCFHTILFLLLLFLEFWLNTCQNFTLYFWCPLAPFMCLYLTGLHYEFFFDLSYNFKFSLQPCLICCLNVSIEFLLEVIFSPFSNELSHFL